LELWTIVLSGPPTSGKTFLARRLLLAIKNSVRINPDELRLMMFNDQDPTHDEELVYSAIAHFRDLAMDHQHSVIIDSTAPNSRTREYLVGESEKSRKLLVVMDVNREILLKRAKASRKLEILKAYDKAWQEPRGSLPVFKFRNDTEQEFETSFYLLMEYLQHEYSQHNSIFQNMFGFMRRKENPEEISK
jgi:predicted kinase